MFAKTASTISGLSGHPIKPGMFGPPPAYGFYMRHVDGIQADHVTLPEARFAFVLDDVHHARFSAIEALQGGDGAALFELRSVTDFNIRDSRDIKDQQIAISGPGQRLQTTPHCAVAPPVSP